MKKAINIVCCIVAIISIIFFGCYSCESNKDNADSADEKTTPFTTKPIEKQNTIQPSSDKMNTTTLPITSSTIAVTDNTSPQNISADNILPLKPISQYPELPTGCEMTSLAMVLNYYNLNSYKCDIADNYLKKGQVGTVDFRKAFVGDPRDNNSYGCYSPVVVETANKYLVAHNVNLKAYNLVNKELEELFTYIDSNIPVIIWGTQDCKEGYYSVTWNVNGEDLTWFTPEHCMVMVGYDDTSVVVADPIYGDLKYYDKNIFKNRYDSLQKQAVVIM